MLPGLDLREPGFSDSACGPFTKHGETIENFKETGNISMSIRIS